MATSKDVIDAEVVIKTVGFSPVNSFIKTALPEALDEGGWIKTDKCFVVPGSDGKVFAYGDCSPTLPNAGSVYMQLCAVLGHNLKVTLTGSTQPMKEGVVPTASTIATSGPTSGVYQMGSWWWGRRIFPWLKNKTMFLFSPRMFVNVKDEFKLSKE